MAGQRPSVQEIIKTAEQHEAIMHAQTLIDKINDTCFERCIPKPGSSISGGERTCYSACLQKYMASWDAVSKAFVSRIQRDGSVNMIGGGQSPGDGLF